MFNSVSKQSTDLTETCAALYYWISAVSKYTASGNNALHQWQPPDEALEQVPLRSCGCPMPGKCSRSGWMGLRTTCVNNSRFLTRGFALKKAGWSLNQCDPWHMEHCILSSPCISCLCFRSVPHATQLLACGNCSELVRPSITFGPVLQSPSPCQLLILSCIGSSWWNLVPE